MKPILGIAVYPTRKEGDNGFRCFDCGPQEGEAKSGDHMGAYNNEPIECFICKRKVSLKLEIVYTRDDDPQTPGERMGVWV